MKRDLAAVTLLVRDYDEAIDYFTNVLDFALLEDKPMGPDKRWVRIAPQVGNGIVLLLARAGDDAQRAAVGRQTGGRVAFFLHTDDLARDFTTMKARGVAFIEEPRDEAYGRVVVFADLYGNLWDLIEPRSTTTAGAEP